MRYSTSTQWIGVILAIISFASACAHRQKEGINFKHNKWIYFIVLAAVLGAVSGLYDKYLMAPPENGGVGLDRMIVQSWYNIYQCFLDGSDAPDDLVANEEELHS